MITFQVNDMSCGHCVSRITAAVQAVDPAARVEVDLAQHSVAIDSVCIEPLRFEQAIRAAGYTPMPR